MRTQRALIHLVYLSGCAFVSICSMHFDHYLKAPQTVASSLGLLSIREQFIVIFLWDASCPLYPLHRGSMCSAALSDAARQLAFRFFQRTETGGEVRSAINNSSFRLRTSRGERSS